ncbi:MAG: hypothetical protein H6733_14090 [Alphaproteobacteria bacterium]|nr:hypothetical protein [Alphaproteobacteria bacterium]
MTSPTATLDPLVNRQVTVRVVRETVGMIVSTLLVGSAFVAPMLVIVASSIPQVVAVMPEPTRRVTLMLDGVQGLADALTEGADGDDGDALVEDAADEADDGDDDALAGGDETPAAAPEPPPPPPPAPEPEVERLPDPKPAPKPEPAPEPPPEAEPAAAAPPAADDAVAEAPVDAAKAPTEGDGGKRTRKDKRAGRCGENHPDIIATGDQSWQVRKTLIEYYTSSVEHLNTLGYSRRYEEDGVKGWLVGGFGCLSPLYKGGLRSQDVVQAVNGKKTNNVLQLFGIWLSQRNKKAFEIEVLRKGQPVTLHYEVI